MANTQRKDRDQDMNELTRSLLFGAAAVLTVAILTLATGPWTGATLATSIPAAAAAGIIVALLHHWKTQLFATLRQYHGDTGRRLAALDERVAETQGLVQLTPLEPPYPMPFGGGWALTADAAALLAREVALLRPKVVVELGSGVSTVLLGRLFKQWGEGKVYSLDHDAAWAERTRQHLRASHIEQHAEVLDAPLARQRFGDRDYLWYSVPEAVRSLSIDLLIVDGPPAALEPNGMPRYPALPAFLAQLSPQAVVYVDDARRPQEQAMVERWLAEYPGFERAMYDTVPGTCLLRRKA
jgi:predicted O-methyltransferase YrrM